MGRRVAQYFLVLHESTHRIVVLVQDVSRFPFTHSAAKGKLEASCTKTNRIAYIANLQQITWHKDFNLIHSNMNFRILGGVQVKRLQLRLLMSFWLSGHSHC